MWHLLLQHKGSSVKQADFTFQLRTIRFMSEVLGNESGPPTPAAETGWLPVFGLISSLGLTASQALFTGRKVSCRTSKTCSLRKLGTGTAWSGPGTIQWDIIGHKWLFFTRGGIVAWIAGNEVKIKPVQHDEALTNVVSLVQTISELGAWFTLPFTKSLLGLKEPYPKGFGEVRGR